MLQASKTHETEILDCNTFYWRDLLFCKCSVWLFSIVLWADFFEVFIQLIFSKIGCTNDRPISEPDTGCVRNT